MAPTPPLDPTLPSGGDPMRSDALPSDEFPTDGPTERTGAYLPSGAPDALSKTFAWKPEPDRTDVTGEYTPTQDRAADHRTAAAAVSELPGYEILGELGQGGMGIVYKARQVHLKRLVALKMIRGPAGDQDLLRFRLEAESVAKLQHPNIVQIYDIGAEPAFFAMEFVEGGSLDRLVRTAPLEPRVAAMLVRTLALAMQAAHDRSLIHRDLKPANILMQRMQGGSMSGESLRESHESAVKLGDVWYRPKITDFGLAKTLDEDSGNTQSGAILGTPSYMAPEQAKGKIRELDAGVDIYALGAILYDLLTGRPPFKGTSPVETLWQVTRDEPVPPSRLQPKVPRDLEIICLKCLHKQRPARYATAVALAEDLDRFLKHQPILARATTPWERAFKWALRNPVIASLTAALVLGAVVSVVLITWSWRQAVAAARAEAAQRRRAESNFRYAREAVDQLLTQVGRIQLAHEPRMEQVRRQLLEQALQFNERFLKQDTADPGMRQETARAQMRLGDIRQMLGEYEAAEAAYRKALELFAAADRDSGRCANNLGNLLRETGRLTEAEAAYGKAVDLWRDALAQHADDAEARQQLALSENNLGVVRRMRGELAAAEEDLRSARRRDQELVEKHPGHLEYRQEWARASNNLGEVLAARGHHREAEAAFTQARTAFEQLAQRAAEGKADGLAQEYRREAAVSSHALGNLLRDRDPAAAEKHYRQALATRQELVANFPSVPLYRQELARSWGALATLLQVAGQKAKADEAAARALELKTKLAEEFPQVPGFRLEQARSLNDRGVALHLAGKTADAEKTYRKAIDLLQALADKYPATLDYPQELGRTQSNLAALLQSTGRLDEADDVYRQLLTRWQEVEKRMPEAPEVRYQQARAVAAQGTLRRLQMQPAAAEPAFREGLRLLTAVAERCPQVPDYQLEVALIDGQLADLLRSLGRGGDAEPFWRDAEERLLRLTEAHPDVPQYRQELTRLQSQRKKAP